MRLGLMVLPVSFAIFTVGYGQDCDHSVTIINQDFAFRASSDYGAVGDVVAIELSLLVENIHGGIYYYAMNVVYDNSLIEIVGIPQYSEIHEQLIFWEINDNIADDYRLPGSSGKALSLVGLFAPNSADEFFAAGNVLPIATVYFRLIGKPGDSSQIRFSDGEFKWPGRTTPCIDNSVGFYDTEGATYLKVRSIQHIPGEIRIVEGEATRIEVPSSPPLAKIYPEPPTPETANIHFELIGGNVRAGATEVPVNLYITSNYEFSSYLAAGTFPSQYLALQRIEEHVRPGVQQVDNQKGEFWIVSEFSRWRMGFEKERVLAATLYFNVNQSAADAGTLPLRMRTLDIGSKTYINWIGVNNETGRSPRIPIVTEVEPFVITQAALNILSAPVSMLGDANYDRTFDIADPVTVVAFLFLNGARPACMTAADFNTDSQIDIADPIVMLTALFLGDHRAGGVLLEEIACE